MKKDIIIIDEDKCSACGKCVAACHMGAIAIVDGKAKVVREDYCDGLGRCLPVCQAGAIRFETQKIEEKIATTKLQRQKGDIPAFSCPGAQAKAIVQEKEIHTEKHAPPMQSHLQQWPVQIRLVPANAAYFHHAHLLIAADCAAYAYGNFHAEYMKGKITIIGCPKLDEGDDIEKLTQIIAQNQIQSITVARMEVPCCTGIEHAAKIALQNSGKQIPCQVVTLSTDGKVIAP